MNSPETNPFSLFFNLIAKHYVGLIAVIVFSVSGYLWVAEKPLPQFLQNIDMIVVAFLFGKTAGKAEGKSSDN